MIVPYIAAWSSEQWQRVENDPNSNGLPSLMLSGRLGKGKPLHGVQHEGRVREVVNQFRCQVCGEKMGVGIIALNSSTKLENGWSVSPEPWACEPCMRLAVKMCPGIRNHFDDYGFFVVDDPKKTSKLATKLGNFDIPPNHSDPLPPKIIDRLNRAAKRHNGIIGPIRIALDPSALPVWRP